MSLRIILTHVYAWPEVRRGGERYLHEVASGLQAAGHQVRVISTAPTPHRARIRGVDVQYLRRLTVLPRRFGELSPEISFGVESMAAIGYRRFDVWHALGTSDAAAASMLSSIRRVRSVYTDLGITARAWREDRPDRRLFNVVVRRADRYICLSEAAARSVRRDYDRDVLVLGGGVDTRAFAPTGARAPAPTLFFPAAVDEPRKNFRLLVAALPMLLERRPDVRLVVAGAGNIEAALADATPRVRDAVISLGVGSLEDLPRRYGQAWVTVLPSSGEAFGLVVLESLACGTPVVTLDDGGPAELVVPGTGVVATGAAESLAHACDEALDLAARADTRELCRAAAEAHDWRRRIVPRLERIYSDA